MKKAGGKQKRNMKNRILNLTIQKNLPLLKETERKETERKNVDDERANYLARIHKEKSRDHTINYKWRGIWFLKYNPNKKYE